MVGINLQNVNGHPSEVQSTMNGVHSPTTPDGSHEQMSEATRNGSHSTETNGSGPTSSAANGPSNRAKTTHIRASQIPIAVCGMALRLPGGLRTPQQFWDFLLNKGDARSRVPESRYKVSSFYDPSGKPATIPTEYGYFLDEDLGALDTSFFSMARTEVARESPEHRLMLEVARECFEDAGEASWKAKSIGCYMGCFGEDWQNMFTREPQAWGQYRATGPGDYNLSNRVSYEFDLRGPSVTTRTACSSALTALNEACAAISKGDCEAALVGGANLIMTPDMTSAIGDQGVLSPEGSCKTFSADADGYARGEAITAVFVKPLDAAIRDGNPIRAVIRGTATNSDGKTPTLSCPSTDAHETLIRRAYNVAGITELSQTAFVECHGTGTPTGDPIEAKAVARVFGEWGVHIGSVKPNTGHTEGASGLVSLIKAVLALENRTIPPNIKLGRPNPAIPFEEANLVVPLKPTPWPKDRTERVSVNSFGVGGANAHVIIDSAASFKVQKPSGDETDTPQLLLFSANAQSSLGEMIENYRSFVEANPENVRDVAHTLATRREHLPHRAFAIAKGGILQQSSGLTKPAKPAQIVMVFTGQGAQWPRMGSELMQTFPEFRKSIRNLDNIISKAVCVDWTIERELSKLGKRSRIHLAEFSQPLCTAIQIALVDTLAAFDVVPSAVVGHSSGEIAAAYASGALTAEEAILAAVYRGQAVNGVSQPGAMAAVGLDIATAKEYLVPGVTVACDNSPKSVTISGDVAQLDNVLATIQASRSDVLCRKLNVDKAYHSYHMSEIGELYRNNIGQISGRAPTIPFFSSVTGKLLHETDTLGAEYWQRNLESPVLFRSAVSAIARHPIGANAIFLEIGPHSALAGPLRQIFSHESKPLQYVSAMLRGQDCTDSLLSAIGKLYTLHVPMNLSTLYLGGSCLPDLPRYPWNHEESFWYESRISKEHRQRQFPHHDILGVRIVESTSSEPAWRNLLHPSSIDWLQDHKIGEDIVFPFAGYVAMAGEAARQISGSDETIRVRHMTASTALVLTEGEPTEIITSLKRHRLTESLESTWWEFSISSHNGHIWTKHCGGQVMADSAILDEGIVFDPLPRRVPSKPLLESLRRAGINLGPTFHNFDSISTDGTKHQTRGEILNGHHADASKYHLHPGVIDSVIQLMAYNIVQQKYGSIQKMLPVGIEEVCISRCSSNFIFSSYSRLMDGDVPTGEGRGVVEGTTVLSMSGMKLAVDYDAEADDETESALASRLHWAPDIRFADLRSLVRPYSNRPLDSASLNKLYELCLLLNEHQLANATVEGRMVEMCSSWINDQIMSLGITTHACQDLDGQALHTSIEALVAELSETHSGLAASLLSTMCSNIQGVIEGRIESLEDLLPAQTQVELERHSHSLDISAFIKAVSHHKPNLRVLEISASHSAPSEDIFASLQEKGHQLCSKYTLAARGYVSQQSKIPNVEYATLDVTVNPLEQGFEPGRYDLIVARDIVPGSKDVQSILRHMKHLLSADGFLFVEMPSVEHGWTKYVNGPTRVWQHGVSKLVDEFIQAGFSVRDGTILDSTPPYHVNVGVIAQQPVLEKPIECVSVLTRINTEDSDYIIQKLEARGYAVSRCSLQDDVPHGHHVLSLLDLETPFFDNIDGVSFEEFKRFIARLVDSKVLWITRLSQIDCVDPRYAAVVGLARTLRSEMLIDFATCEVDDFKAASDQILQIFDTLARRGDMDVANELKPDFEYVVRRNVVNVGRIYPFTLQDELSMSEPDDRAMLDIRTLGRLSTLHWAYQPAPPAPQSDEVEIEMYAVGLNFRDVLVGMKIVEFPLRIIGFEGAGVIRRVGSQVKGLKVGDRVAVFENNIFATTVVTLEALCVKLPDELSFDDASVMFFPYATAMHSLIDVGGLKQGQSVLIHSACGGVGLAALQLARMVRADIFVTVGSEEKVQYLMQHYGLPRNRILHSRNSSFVQGIMAQTNHQGVDLILNSVSGELLHETWKCVAPFGKLVEIGKRDLIGRGKLDMQPFLANRSYCCVDISKFRQTPAMLSHLLSRTLQYYKEGLITALNPVKVFDASHVYDAFTYMQPGQHIGRISVTIRRHADATCLPAQIAPRRKELTLFNDASYLLVGALGGIGRAVCVWMVRHGARHLTFLSRSAGLRDEDRAFVEELNSMGCQVQMIRGSVTDPNDVARALAESLHTIRGIVQMSMVLRDESFVKMTYDDWHSAMAPKVQGTWNLHNASVSAGNRLDFFVLFSSISGIIGNPGQANYASANTTLDAFVQYRNNMGLAASAIDIGAVRDIGYLSQNAKLLQSLGAAGMRAVRTQELFDSLVAAMTCQPGRQSGFGTGDQNVFMLGLGSNLPLNSPNNRAVWKQDRRMAVYHNNSPGGTDSEGSPSSASGLKAYIANATSEPEVLRTPEAACLFAREIGKRLFGLLLKPEEEVNIKLPLVDLGMDSLVGIELRSWWKSVFGFDISVLEMLGMGTLEALGEHAARGLLLRCSQA